MYSSNNNNVTNLVILNDKALQLETEMDFILQRFENIEKKRYQNNFIFKEALLKTDNKTNITYICNESAILLIFDDVYKHSCVCTNDMFTISINRYLCSDITHFIYIIIVMFETQFIKLNEEQFCDYLKNPENEKNMIIIFIL